MKKYENVHTPVDISLSNVIYSYGYKQARTSDNTGVGRNHWNCYFLPVIQKSQPLTVISCEKSQWVNEGDFHCHSCEQPVLTISRITGVSAWPLGEPRVLFSLFLFVRPWLFVFSRFYFKFPDYSLIFPEFIYSLTFPGFHGFPGR